MEQSILSLLTPTAPEGKAPALPQTALDAISSKEQFAAILQQAETRLRTDGKDRVLETEKAEHEEKALEILSGIKDIPEQEGELIAGIMPVMTPPLSDIPTQESIVAAVVFDSELPDPKDVFNAVEAATVHNGGVSVAGVTSEEVIAEGEIIALKEARLFPQDTIDVSIQAKQHNNKDVLIEQQTILSSLEFEYDEAIANVMPASYVAMPPENNGVGITTATNAAASIAYAATPPARTITHPLQETISRLPSQTPHQIEGVDGAPKQSTSTPLSTDAFTTIKPVLNATQPQNFAETLQASTQLSSQPQNFSEAIIFDAAQTIDDIATTQNNQAQQSSQVEKASPQRSFAQSTNTLNIAPAEQIALHISQAFADNKNRIMIRLHPEELGRIDVRLDIDNDNNTILRVLAENRDTYEFLRADKSTLERILQDSGLRTDQEAMEFGYQGNKGDEERHYSSSQHAGTETVLEEDLVVVENDIPTGQLQILTSTSGLNIKV